ncbi:MAG: right-handed parallel beta-helix repeat-containing protein [Candidatus Helarchaeota archaeon]
MNEEQNSKIYLYPDNLENNAKYQLLDFGYFFAEHIIQKYLQNGLYFKNGRKIEFRLSRISNQNLGLDVFHCDEWCLSNNLFTNLQNGIKSTNMTDNLKKNIFLEISKVSLIVNSPKNLVVKNNVFAKCSNAGLSLNDESYGFTDTNLKILENDFISNEIHIKTGYDGNDCFAQYNNFINDEIL